MNKDKELLKDRLESLRETDMRMRKLYKPNSVEHRHFNGRLAAIDEVLDFIDELDEPEVLSQKWINEHLFSLGDKYPWKKAVPAVDLQNLIVPKKELPVIPKYVADWIEDLKSKKINLLENIYDFTHEEDIYNYIREQGNELMRAWLDGYEVEEEPKYVIKLDDESYLQRYEIDNKNIVTPFRIVGHLKEVAIKFDSKEKAEKVAELVEGKVKEVAE